MLSNMLRRLGIGRKVNLRPEAGGEYLSPGLLHSTLPEVARQLGMTRAEEELATDILGPRLARLHLSHGASLAIDCYLSHCAEARRSGSAEQFVRAGRANQRISRGGTATPLPEMEKSLECRLLARVWADIAARVKADLDKQDLVLNRDALELIEAAVLARSIASPGKRTPSTQPGLETVFETRTMAENLGGQFDGGKEYEAIETGFRKYLEQTPDTYDLAGIHDTRDGVVEGLIVRHSLAAAERGKARTLARFLSISNCRELFQNPHFNERSYQDIAGAWVNALPRLDKGGRLAGAWGQPFFEEGWKLGWTSGARNVTKAAQIVTSSSIVPGPATLHGLACIPEIAHMEDVAETILVESRSNGAVNRLLRFSTGPQWLNVVSRQLRTLEYTQRDGSSLAEALAFSGERHLAGVRTSDLVDLVACSHAEVRAQGMRLMGLARAMDAAKKSEREPAGGPKPAQNHRKDRLQA